MLGIGYEEKKLELFLVNKYTLQTKVYVLLNFVIVFVFLQMLYTIVFFLSINVFCGRGSTKVRMCW